MTATDRIRGDRARIAEPCRRYPIRRRALFGSVLRDDSGPESDVDVLVELEDGKTPGFARFDLQDELSEIVGRRVDSNAPGCLSRFSRDEVLALAEDRMSFLAVIRLVEIVGEAAEFVSPEPRDASDEIPWRGFAGTRDRLVHGYADVDRNLLWRIVRDELPAPVDRLEILPARRPSGRGGSTPQ